MTDRAFKIYQGEDLAPVTDLTDMVIWETAEFGARAYLGEAASAQVTIRDEQGRTGNSASLPNGLTSISLAAGNVLELELGSNVLWRGRMASKDYSRGAQRAERYRQAATYLEDVNIDLRGIVVHGWSRPSESDVARVQALVARYLSGDPRPSTVVNGSNLVVTGSNTVTVPAQTYTKTDVEAVFSEIARAANKTYYLLPRDGTSDAHTATLVYDGNDAVVERCPYHITDHEDEVRASPDHYFFPIFNVGPAATENGQELISGVWLFYGSGDNDYVHVSDATQANLYIHREIVMFDDTITTAAEATKAANAILSFRKYEEKTINVTIGPLTDAHVASIQQGQTIGIKAKAIPFADDAEYDAKITQLTLTTYAPGRWFAHLQLDRPWRLQPYGKGTKPGPQPSGDCSTPSVVRYLGSGGNALSDLTVEGAANTAMIIVAFGKNGTSPSFTYDPDSTSAVNPTSTLTRYGQVSNTNGTTEATEIELHYLLNPPASNGAHGNINATIDSHTQWLAFLMQDVNVDSFIRTTDSAIGTTNMGNPGSINNTVSAQANDLVLSLVAYTTQQTGADAPVPGADQTLIFGFDGFTAIAGQDVHFGGASTQPGTGATQTNSWTVQDALGGAMTQWDIVLTGCDPAISIGGPGDGTVGSGTDYVPGGTVIEHGDLSGKGGTMHDATQIEFDPTGLTNTDAADVQEAIEDLDAAISSGGAPTTVDYLVGTASAGLSAEIVVGTTPGGELGGTWANPTVDTTHSGSAHHTEDHATRHASGGGDAVKLDDLAAPDDNTDLNASTSKHGLLPKLGGGTTNFLRADGTWNAPGGAGVTLSDDTPLEESGTGDAGDASTASRSDHVHPEHAGSGSGSSPFSLDALDLDSTYGDEFDGTSLDAKWTRLGIDADTEEFGIGGTWMSVHRRKDPTTGGEGYYQTPVSMPDYMELIFSGSYEVSGGTNNMAGPYFVTSGGAGYAAGIAPSDSAFQLQGLSSGVASGSVASITRSGMGATMSAGIPQWVRLIRFVADGATMVLAQYSLDGNTWSDFVSTADSTAVTRIAFGRFRSGAADHPQVLSINRFNTVALTLGNNLCRTPTSGTATYSASSSFSGFSASSAFDANHSTDWASNGYAANQYIQCAWSVAQTVNTILLRGRTSDTWAYGKVEFSDGSTVPIPYMTTTVNNCVVIRLPTAKSTTLLKVISTSGGATNPGFRAIEAYNAS